MPPFSTSLQKEKSIHRNSVSPAWGRGSFFGFEGHSSLHLNKKVKEVIEIAKGPSVGLLPEFQWRWKKFTKSLELAPIYVSTSYRVVGQISVYPVKFDGRKTKID
ncbi:hypothetical protein RF11_07207 [Thelohanellus kitauei]|uniref:Uncharacterized protein n=1 Tax=Thelohanellus kitauei TaxID=669202 RepID=A0A0C2NAU7_THEKT|nr:hypothetical protein RF11_07207 [Thelohanellus kitauei]